MDLESESRHLAEYGKISNIRALKDNQNDWYFGAINRSEAENILIKNGSSEGLFLVRESVSSPGDYALSVVQSGSIVHYQIRKIGDDAFFSIDNGLVIHGLDMLLKYLRELSDTNDSVIILKNHCRCENPPPDTRRHGRNNLLHRATACADERVVSELLRADRHNVDAKNESGQTAIHLAVQLLQDSNSRILYQLIKAGANVNSRDSESMTPLHYCSKYNKPKAAKLLIVEGQANTHCRKTDNGWVALHFAAYLGHSQVIRVLLDCGAALHPRDSFNETPKDIAERMNHLECKKLFDLYADRPHDNCPPRNQWLCDQIKSRYETNGLFEKSGMKDGSFLVRKSANKHNTYVLAMVFDSRVYNFEIKQNSTFYFIDSGPYWPSLEHLISYYLKNSDGLPSKLSFPVLLFADMNKDINKTENKALKYSDDKNANENIESILFIDNKELKIENLIGKGEYGDVLKGIWRRVNKETTLVAIKIFRKQDMRISQKIDSFLSEVEVLARLKHPYIIKLLGVCTGPTLMLVQELASLGNLLDFLIDHPKEIDISHDFKLWSAQIAIGMSFLESKHFIHRDLAARNILLMSIQQVKISDFGLSRALKEEADYYKASNRDRWPIKWYAPESINYGIFTHASDVWSYGILLWEMYSFGEQPYGDQSNGSQIIGYVEDGKRLSKPIKCSDSVYALISLCWSYDPKNRPAFHEIVEIMLTNDPTYESIRNELKCSVEM
jgi:tyrosine-protein kinase